MAVQPWAMASKIGKQSVPTSRPFKSRTYLSTTSTPAADTDADLGSPRHIRHRGPRRDLVVM